jgi:diaminopimelate dehydrogenase
MPHGGSVIHSGITGINGEHTHTVEFSLKLDSNPEFTASVLVAYARAVAKMKSRGDAGAKTVFDVTLSDLSLLSESELRAKLL